MNDAFRQLLANPRIWQGQAGDQGLPGLPSGYPKLDRRLPGGGWPRNALTEILLERYGSGELQLLMPALAYLSQPRDDAAEAGWITWVAPPFAPYAPALGQWGVNLSRVLIVRPKKAAEVLWAAEQALSSGNCAAVLLWPNALDDAASRRIQLAAEKGQSWAIAFRSLKALSRPSVAALRIRLSRGEKGTDLGILKSRGGRPGVVENYADCCRSGFCGSGCRSGFCGSGFSREPVQTRFADKSALAAANGLTKPGPD